MTVYKRGSAWWANFRSEGLGQRRLGVLATESEKRAWQAATRLLDELRASGGGPRGQVELPAGKTFHRAAEECRQVLKCRTTGNRKFLDGYIRRAGELRCLKNRLVRDFAPPEGVAILFELRRWLREDQKVSAPTCRNYFCAVRRVLRFAKSRGWVASLPDTDDWPRPADEDEQMYEPGRRWLNEGQFLRLLDEICPDLRKRAAGGDEEAAAALGKHRLYLAIGYYCGYHRRDIEEFSDDDLRGPVGTLYFHRNRKNSRVYHGSVRELPPVVARLILAEYERRGGFAVGKPIVGEWSSCCRAMGEACRRLGWEPINRNDLRRSFVTELRERGVEEDDVRKATGHTTSAMIRKVYDAATHAAASAVIAAWKSKPAEPAEACKVISLPFGAASATVGGAGVVPVTPESQTGDFRPHEGEAR